MYLGKAVSVTVRLLPSSRRLATQPPVLYDAKA